MKRSKAYRAAEQQIEEQKLYSPVQAVQLAKSTTRPEFDPTVEVALRLGVDPRKADQMVRGTVNLPHGTGKTARVLVRHRRPGRGGPRGRRRLRRLRRPDRAHPGRLAGLRRGGRHPGPDGQGRLLGPVLGPRGLMPNPNTGTVTPTWARPCPTSRAARSSSASTGTATCTHHRQGVLRRQVAGGEHAAALEEIVRLASTAAKGRYLRRSPSPPRWAPGSWSTRPDPRAHRRTRGSRRGELTAAGLAAALDLAAARALVAETRFARDHCHRARHDDRRPRMRGGPRRRAKRNHGPRPAGTGWVHAPCALRRAFCFLRPETAPTPPARCPRAGRSGTDRRMPMARADKVAAVAELTERFQASSGAVLTEYRGLTVAQLGELRQSLGENATFTVVKNTPTRIAATEAGVGAGSSSCSAGRPRSPSCRGDVVEAAKGLRDFAKANPLPVIRRRARRQGHDPGRDHQSSRTWSRARCCWPSWRAR